MAQVQQGDFIELAYTGTLKDGQVFDTTDEKVAQKNNLVREGSTFKPVIICVGKQHLLPALDEELLGKEIGSTFSIVLSPQRAFGKREPSKLFNKNWFIKQKVTPVPGLEVTLGNDRGIIRSVSGGRVYVDMNHPLAGQEVNYSCTIISKVDDMNKKICAITKLRLGIEDAQISIEQEKAEINIKYELPEQLTEFIKKEIEESTGIKEVIFKYTGDVAQE